MTRKNHDITYESDQEGGGINLTPLIDVVFVVLIMFIIIAPMHDIDHVALAEGAGIVKELSAKEGISVYVREDNTLWFKKQKVTERELLQCLLQAKKEHPEAVPQIYHDKKAYFGTYQEVKNIVESAGFDRMDIILKPA